MVRSGLVLWSIVVIALVGCGGGQEAPAPAPDEKAPPAAAAPAAQPQAAVDDGYEELDVWIEAEPDEGPPPLRVHFTSEVESDEDDGGPFTYEWDFGDGGKSKEANPIYTYKKLGEYTVTLVARDNKGNNGSDEIDVWVEEEE
jgi:PKD repeat protein